MEQLISLDEMKAIADELQIKADQLTELVDDIMSFHEPDQQLNLLNKATDRLQQLKNELANAPFIKTDLSDFENEIDALLEGHHRGITPMLNSKISYESYAESSARYFVKHNHLGKAAVVKAELKKAIKEKDFDRAWAANEMIKYEYLLHAVHQHWNKTHTTRLSGRTFETSANILRLEGRHKEALRHFLYFLVHSASYSNSHLKKLRAYLGRSKLPGANTMAAMAFLEVSGVETEFQEIDEQLRLWADK